MSSPRNHILYSKLARISTTAREKYLFKDHDPNAWKFTAILISIIFQRTIIRHSTLQLRIKIIKFNFSHKILISKKEDPQDHHYETYIPLGFHKSQEIIDSGGKAGWQWLQDKAQTL